MSTLQEFITLKEENSTSHSPHRRTGKPVARHSQKRKSSRDRKSSEEGQLASERMRAERREVRVFVKFREQEAVNAEPEARLQVSDMESHTRVLLEEQRSRLISQARFELLLQETKAENSVQKLQRQLRSRKNGTLQRKSRIRSLTTTTSSDSCRTSKPVSALIELCDTHVCFLHSQLIGTNL